MGMTGERYMAIRDSREKTLRVVVYVVRRVMKQFVWSALLLYLFSSVVKRLCGHCLKG